MHSGKAARRLPASAGAAAGLRPGSRRATCVTTAGSKADEFSLYGFTDLPSVHERGTVVVTHGKYIYDTPRTAVSTPIQRAVEHGRGLRPPRADQGRAGPVRALSELSAPSSAGCRTGTVLPERLVKDLALRSSKVFPTNSGSRRMTPWSRSCGSLHGAEGKPRSAADPDQLLSRRHRGLCSMTTANPTTRSSACRCRVPASGLPITGALAGPARPRSSSPARLAAEPRRRSSRKGADTIAGVCFAETGDGRGQR